jgi:hypothetical protein
MTCTRRGFRQLTLGSIATGVFCAAMSGDAFAQEAAPPVETAAPVSEAPVQTLPAEAAAPMAEPPPPVMMQTTAAPAAPEPPAEAPAEEPAAAPWYDAFTISGYVDAYAAFRSDKNNRPLSAPIPLGGYYHEGYVQANGFALALAGVDAVYSGEKLGATISLRFGPAFTRFYAANKSNIGIENLAQAFVTYKPVEALTLDLGQFGTIYGAEVLESWKNVNYSRGALYYAMQPFWHTGLRANIKVADSFAINAMLVNGVNNAFEDNKSPSLGLQAVITASDVLSLAVGYLGAFNQTPTSDYVAHVGGAGLFRNFFDLVATVTTGGFKLVVNADLNLYKPEAGAKGENWWGISVAPAYAFNDVFGIGARFEYLSDSANLWAMTTDKAGETPADKASLTTITATLDIKPISGVANLVLRPEFRYEIASNYYFFDKKDELAKGFWTVMLGAAVSTN